jgi:hypothetical protein
MKAFNGLSHLALFSCPIEACVLNRLETPRAIKLVLRLVPYE